MGWHNIKQTNNFLLGGAGRVIVIGVRNEPSSIPGRECVSLWRERPLENHETIHFPFQVTSKKLGRLGSLGNWSRRKQVMSGSFRTVYIYLSTPQLDYDAIQGQFLSGFW